MAFNLASLLTLEGLSNCCRLLISLTTPVSLNFLLNRLRAELMFSPFFNFFADI